MAEGAPLLREYGVLSLIKGSNPFVSASNPFFIRPSGRFYFLPTWCYLDNLVITDKLESELL